MLAVLVAMLEVLVAIFEVLVAIFEVLVAIDAVFVLILVSSAVNLVFRSFEPKVIDGKILL
jgi:hypothetical protein